MLHYSSSNKWDGEDNRQTVERLMIPLRWRGENWKFAMMICGFVFGMLRQRETILSHSIVWSLCRGFVICTLMAIVINLTASLVSITLRSFLQQATAVGGEWMSKYHKLSAILLYMQIRNWHFIRTLLACEFSRRNCKLFHEPRECGQNCCWVTDNWKNLLLIQIIFLRIVF